MMEIHEILIISFVPGMILGAIFIIFFKLGQKVGYCDGIKEKNNYFNVLLPKMIEESLIKYLDGLNKRLTIDKE